MVPWSTGSSGSTKGKMIVSFGHSSLEKLVNFMSNVLDTWYGLNMLLTDWCPKKYKQNNVEMAQKIFPTHTGQNDLSILMKRSQYIA